MPPRPVLPEGLVLVRKVKQDNKQLAPSEVIERVAKHLNDAKRSKLIIGAGGAVPGKARGSGHLAGALSASEQAAAEGGGCSAEGLRGGAGGGGEHNPGRCGHGAVSGLISMITDAAHAMESARAEVRYVESFLEQMATIGRTTCCCMMKKNARGRRSRTETRRVAHERAQTGTQEGNCRR